MSKNKIEIKNKKAWHDYEFIGIESQSCRLILLFQGRRIIHTDAYFGIFAGHLQQPRPETRTQTVAYSQRTRQTAQKLSKQRPHHHPVAYFFQRQGICQNGNSPIERAKGIRQTRKPERQRQQARVG